MSNYMRKSWTAFGNLRRYEELHYAMSQQGFARMIRGSDGKDYNLPTGNTVMRNASVSRSDALDRAGTAAGQTGKKSSIIVADWESATWRGLSSN